jgi:hemolysin III
MLRELPRYSRAELVADGCIHVTGVAFSLLAAAAMMTLAVKVLPAASTASLGVYAFGMVAVFACSAAYNMANPARPALKAILRRFDHAAIYVKIAGTYTPLALLKIGDAVGLALLGAVWAITAFGATAKLLWPERLVRTSYVLYLVQGWAVVAAFDSLVPAVSSRVLILLVVGGCLYTVGVVFHLWEKLPYHNAIWHAFVLLASGCPFAAIIAAVVLTGAA